MATLMNGCHFLYKEYLLSVICTNPYNLFHWN